MRIVMITTNDPAGSAINFARAVNRTTEHSCRLVTTEIRYNFMFPKDLHVPSMASYGELEESLATADVFHFHMAADEDLALGPFRARDFLRGRTIVHHHHGEPPFRADADRFRRRERALGRAAIVSTPDLLRLYPEASWIPNPVPLHDAAYLPVEKSNPRVRVGHSPTRVELKNTDDFVAAVGGLDVDPVVIRDTAHAECLRIKASCDLFFDHMQGYYGLSSLEALAQGVPTIAGIDAWNAAHLKAWTGAGRLPWVVARDRSELREAIRDLAADAGVRAQIGAASRAWMERYWSEATIARGLVEFYSRQRAGRAVAAA